MVRIVCCERRFASLVPRLRQASNTLLRLTRRNDASLELYICGDKASPHTVYAYPAPARFPRPDLSGRYLGEMYLNPDRIKKEDGDLLAFLVHGFLHLLHYDHTWKNDRLLMEREERRLLRALVHVNPHHRRRSRHS